MRLPNAVHESRPWRIRGIAPDFTLEDVWALPVHGGAGDFPALLEVMTSRDLAREASRVTRLLFGARLLLGRWFGWDDGAERPIPGLDEASLAERLPDDLRGTAAGLRLGSSFSPLYRTGTEFAAELSNQTVHGVLPGLGRSRPRPLPGTDGRLRQAARPARETVHGVHRAVPALGGLPGPAAPDRTGVAGALAEATGPGRQAGGRTAPRMAECLFWAPSCTFPRCGGGSFLVLGLPIAFESSRRRCPGSSWCPRRPGSARRP